MLSPSKREEEWGKERIPGFTKAIKSNHHRNIKLKKIKKRGSKTEIKD